MSREKQGRYYICSYDGEWACMNASQRQYAFAAAIMSIDLNKPFDKVIVHNTFGARYEVPDEDAWPDDNTRDFFRQFYNISCTLRAYNDERELVSDFITWQKQMDIAYPSIELISDCAHQDFTAINSWISRCCPDQIYTPIYKFNADGTKEYRGATDVSGEVDGACKWLGLSETDTTGAWLNRYRRLLALHPNPPTEPCPWRHTHNPLDDACQMGWTWLHIEAGRTQRQTQAKKIE